MLATSIRMSHADSSIPVVATARVGRRDRPAARRQRPARTRIIARWSAIATNVPTTIAVSKGTRDEIPGRVGQRAGPV